MKVWLSCVPPRASHHAKRIVRVGGFSRLADKPELNEAKSTYDALLLPHQPAEPIRGAVSLSLLFVFPHLSATSQKRRGALLPKTSKPDCSNLAKTLEDRLVRLGFIEDDAKVARLIVEKCHGKNPGVSITVEPYLADPFEEAA